MFIHVASETREWIDPFMVVRVSVPSVDENSGGATVLTINMRGWEDPVHFLWTHTEAVKQSGITPLEDFVASLENEKKIGGNNRE